MRSLQEQKLHKLRQTQLVWVRAPFLELQLSQQVPHQVWEEERLLLGTLFQVLLHPHKTDSIDLSLDRRLHHLNLDFLILCYLVEELLVTQEALYVVPLVLAFSPEVDTLPVNT